jgi:hypothetical protein
MELLGDIGRVKECEMFACSTVVFVEINNWKWYSKYITDSYTLKSSPPLGLSIVLMYLI